MLDQQLSLYEKLKGTLPENLPDHIIWSIVNNCTERCKLNKQDISELLNESILVSFDRPHGLVWLFTVDIAPPFCLSWGFDAFSGELVET